MANKVYIAPETAITFKETGGTEPFTPKNITGPNGRISDQYDLGSGSHAYLFEWRMKTKFTATQTGGTSLIEVYLATSDGTIIDGNLSTTDASLTDVDNLLNLHYLDTLVSDEATGTPTFNKSGRCEILARYVSIVWWILTGSTTNTAGDHEFILTPVPPELQ